MNNYAEQPEELKNHQLPVEVLRRVEVIDDSIDKLEKNPIIKDYSQPSINVAPVAKIETPASSGQMSSSDLNVVRTNVDDAYEFANENFEDEPLQEAA